MRYTPDPNQDWGKQVDIALSMPEDSKMGMAQSLFLQRFGGTPPIFELLAAGYSSDEIAIKMLESVRSGEPLQYDEGKQALQRDD